MVAPIGTPPMPNMAQVQKMHSFKRGIVNISKENLTTIQTDMESKGITTPDELKNIISAYDQIDADGDGMSFEELTSYAKENGNELKGPLGKRSPKGPPDGFHNKSVGHASEQGLQMRMMHSNGNNLLANVIAKFMSSDPQPDTSNISINA